MQIKRPHYPVLESVLYSLRVRRSEFTDAAVIDWLLVRSHWFRIITHTVPAGSKSWRRHCLALSQVSIDHPVLIC